MAFNLLKRRIYYYLLHATSYSLVDFLYFEVCFWSWSNRGLVFSSMCI